jgi:hypothetical protein
MFYIIGTKQTKNGIVYGVMDTDDWKVDFCSQAELSHYKSIGFKIYNKDISRKILDFLRSVASLMCDLDGYSVDTLIYCVHNNQKPKFSELELGGSTFDMLERACESGVVLRKEWTDMDLNYIIGKSDIFKFVTYLVDNYTDEEAREDFAKKFNFPLKLVKEMF